MIIRVGDGMARGMLALSIRNRTFKSNSNNFIKPRSHSATPSYREQSKSRLVFLGTPEVSARVLRTILESPATVNQQYEVVAVVSQPAARRGRGHALQPTPTSQLAMEAGIELFTPQTAKEDDFLAAMAAVKPDVCITAAYGNILPNKFLSIPRRGTVNIHPSLLPLYRGASPVQRAIQDGVEHTGVSVAFTVRAMDAGPIIASRRVAVDPEIKAPKLLEQLFDAGTELLLAHLEFIVDGRAALTAVPQDESQVSHAPKVSSSEGVLDLDQSATVLHNKVRAFAGWPGTRLSVRAMEEGALEIPLKVLTTRAPRCISSEWEGMRDGAVQLIGGALCVQCGDGSVLEIVEVQPASKQAMSAVAFWNGLRGRRIVCLKANR